MSNSPSTCTAEEAVTQFKIGLMYANGEGVQKNYKIAAEWYRRAGEHGHIDALYALGFLYENGKGVQKNYKAAAEWYLKAAEHGHIDAQYVIGFLYENGKSVQKNYRAAAEWYLKAAEHSHINAQYALGFLYENGKGVQKSNKAAAEWYRKAAQQSHTGAQIALWLMHEKGSGVLLDCNEIEECCRRAAEHGHASAQYALGGMCESISFSEAVSWYCKAAKQNHAGAQCAIGYLFASINEFQAAAEWYYRAAKQSHADAQYALGLLYENGKGLKQSFKAAKKWYCKAVRQGNVRAGFQLNKILGASHALLHEAPQRRLEVRRLPIATKFIQCHFCGVKIVDLALERHLRECHSSESKQLNPNLVKIPEDGKANLTLAVALGTLVIKQQPRESLCPRCGGDGGVRGGCQKCEGTGWVSREMEHDQSYAPRQYVCDNSRISNADYLGGNAGGHFREMDGRIGSIPMYDDYSEDG